MHGLAGRVGVCRLVGFPEPTSRGLGSLHNCGWITVERHHSRGYWRIAEYKTTAPRWCLTAGPRPAGAGSRRPPGGRKPVRCGGRGGAEGGVGDRFPPEAAVGVAGLSAVPW
jgi:hypothetical protein